MMPSAFLVCGASAPPLGAALDGPHASNAALAIDASKSLMRMFGSLFRQSTLTR
jgi:hypothetical protein